MDRPTLRHGSPADVAVEFDRRTKDFQDFRAIDIHLALANALARIAKLEDRLRVMQQAQQVAPGRPWINSDIHDD